MTVHVLHSAMRGRADHGWLQSRHSFSFADFYNPQQMGYRSLRVINEDLVQGGTGFPTHPHRDMEIVTYIVDGALEHKDSTGGHSIINRGEVQRMTAGTGVRHSEFNASKTDSVHLLQIWILPAERNLTPGYEQKLFAEADKHNRLCPIVTPDGRDGSLKIHQDVSLYASVLDAGAVVEQKLAAGRGAWIQVVSGDLMVNDQAIAAGDGAAIEDAGTLRIAAGQASEFILFDLA
jgi:redox-sensitive bicupin YhaK (pirin superfamily)